MSFWKTVRQNSFQCLSHFFVTFISPGDIKLVCIEAAVFVRKQFLFHMCSNVINSVPVSWCRLREWYTCGALWCVSNMAGSLSSSMEGTGFSDSDMSADESTSSVAHREKNLMSLLKQENRVLKMELETCKLRCKQLQEENRALRQASVSIVSQVLNLSFSELMAKCNTRTGVHSTDNSISSCHQKLGSFNIFTNKD